MQPKAKTKSGLKAGKTQSKIGPKQKKDLSFPLEKENFIIITIGVVLIIVGYLLMKQNSVDGFVPTVIAPILLFLGYCVAIPYGILKRPKTAVITDSTAVNTETDKVPAVKSNIKVG
ncbi:MAG TPA: DUF3098 domain-containing protein [Ignavibacteria bacterium]|jgi:hypothetical protein